MFFIPCPAIVYGVLYVGYSVWTDARSAHGNVNHSAHFWGAAYGVLFTLLMEPRLFGTSSTGCSRRWVIKHSLIDHSD